MPRTPPAKSTTRQEQAEARRLQIIDVALSLFAQHGFAATSTRRIAEEVGVTEGLIFHYFPTKSDLLLAVAHQRMEFLGEVLTLLERAGELPARQVLGGIVLGWVKAIHHQADIITMLLVESQTNDDLRVAFRSVVDQIVGAMATYLSSRVQAGELRSDLPTRTSAMLFFSSLMMFFLTNRDLPLPEWEAEATAFTSEMLDTWFRGSLARPFTDPQPPASV